MRYPIAAALTWFGTPASLAAQEGGAGLFSVDLGLSIWTIVVFLVVLLVLGKFAWGPILGALDAREAGIRDAIGDAVRMKEEAQALLDEHRKQLADARRQAQEILNSGREAGARVRDDIESKARSEAERMVQQARTEIVRERDQALDRVRTEAVELALAAASKLLQERLDSEADRALVERFLDELDRRGVEA